MRKLAYSRRYLAGILLSVVFSISACTANANPSSNGSAGSLAEIAQVSQTTYVDTFETTGSISPVNSAALAWTTTGTISEAPVQPGDYVSAGTVLMTLDPASTNLSSAEQEVKNARQALEQLTLPDAAAVTAAGKNLSSAFATWRQARSDLNTQLIRYTYSGDLELYYAWRDANSALEQALNALPLANASLDIQSAFQALSAADRLDEFAAEVQAASAAYPDDAVLQQKAADLQQASTGSRQLAENRLAGLEADPQTLLQTLVEAMAAYEHTAAGFSASLTGTNAFEYAVRLNAQYASYQSSRTALESAVVSLYQLARQPDASAFAEAQELLAAAEANLQNVQETLTLIAPFDGQVIAVNFQPGDTADTKVNAVELVDRQNLYLTLSIEEARVLKLKTSDPAKIILEARPEVELNGRVAYINPVGTSNQGVVYYSVRVEIDQPDTEVLIGSTAGVTIQTGSPRQVLVVPVTAVQNDAAGEYVNRMAADGSYQRVSVISGLILEDDTVIVEGELGVGEQVAVYTLTSSSSENARMPGIGGILR